MGFGARLICQSCDVLTLTLTLTLALTLTEAPHLPELRRANPNPTLTLTLTKAPHLPELRRARRRVHSNMRASATAECSRGAVGGRPYKRMYIRQLNVRQVSEAHRKLVDAHLSQLLGVGLGLGLGLGLRLGLG